MSVIDRDLAACNGMKLTQGALAAALDVSREAVRTWHAEGLPFDPRDAIGEENGYDLARVVTWLIRRETAKAYGGETPKDRLARVQADRIELELAEKRGQLVPIAEIEPQWARIVDAIRTELLGLPERPELGLDEIKRDLLREVVEGVLQNLSESDPTDQPNAQGGN